MVTIYETVIVKVTGFGFKARGLKVWSFEASGPICFTSPEREEYSLWVCGAGSLCTSRQGSFHLEVQL